MVPAPAARSGRGSSPAGGRESDKRFMHEQNPWGRGIGLAAEIHAVIGGRC